MTSKDSVAKLRWKTLASTVRRIKSGDVAQEDEPQSFRFPAFDIIDIRPDIAPQSALNRLWFRVTCPDYQNIDIKVHILYSTPSQQKLIPNS
jgi:hypothetical protein